PELPTCTLSEHDTVTADTGPMGYNPRGEAGGSERFADGEVILDETDLTADGFGLPWGLTRSWSNGGHGYDSGSFHGVGWVDNQLPSLVWLDHATGGVEHVAVITNGSTARLFDYDPLQMKWVPRHFLQNTLSGDDVTGRYTFTEADGSQFTFSDFSSA